MSILGRLAASAAILIAAFAAPLAHAQPVLSPVGSFTGDDVDGTVSSFGDGYGAAIERWGEWLFVGAPRETTFRGGSDQQDGAVYVYKFDAVLLDYVLTQKITRPGNSALNCAAVAEGDRFGAGIAVADGWAFIAAANDQDFPALVDPRVGAACAGDPPFRFAGKVIVYQLDAVTDLWSEVQTLTAPTPGTFGAFGARTQSTHVAINPRGNIAVVGESMNFAGGLGQFHTYNLQAGLWTFRQTIAAPAGLEAFGEAVVFAGRRHIVVGGADYTAGAGNDFQGFVYAFKGTGAPGQFSAAPSQTISGIVVPAADANCVGQGNVYGEAGLAAAGGKIAVAEPCATGAAGAFAGRVDIYRVDKTAVLPLIFEQSIEGDAADLYSGSNEFGSREAIRLNDAGDRLLIGSPRSPAPVPMSAQVGADARLFANDPILGWLLEATLTSSLTVAANTQQFGDTLLFVDENRALAREGNFLNPVVLGSRKGQLSIYDLP